MYNNNNNNNNNKNLNPKLNRSLSLSIDKNKSFLEILDSVQEIKEEEEIKTKYINAKKCKSCDKLIVTNIDNHQIKCFQKKIKDLEEQLKLKEDQIKHDIHIKGLELLIDRNNKKWETLYLT
jgi:hypothetical protein